VFANCSQKMSTQRWSGTREGAVHGGCGKSGSGRAEPGSKGGLLDNDGPRMKIGEDSETRPPRPQKRRKKKKKKVGACAPRPNARGEKETSRWGCTEAGRTGGTVVMLGGGRGKKGKRADVSRHKKAQPSKNLWRGEKRE